MYPSKNNQQNKSTQYKKPDSNAINSHTYKYGKSQTNKCSTSEYNSAKRGKTSTTNMGVKCLKPDEKGFCNYSHGNIKKLQCKNYIVSCVITGNFHQGSAQFSS